MLERKIQSDQRKIVKSFRFRIFSIFKFYSSESFLNNMIMTWLITPGIKKKSIFYAEKGEYNLIGEK